MLRPDVLRDRFLEPLFPRAALRRRNTRLRLKATGIQYTLLDRFSRDSAMLSTFPGAAKDRTTQDWKSNPFSADAAVVTDNPILSARARLAVLGDGIA